MLKLFIARPFFSKIYGFYQNSKLSKKDIKPFCDKFNIPLRNDEILKFKSFNDFFTRKQYKVTHGENNTLYAIADGKLSVYTINDELKLKIKNAIYTVDELIENKEISSYFKNGTCLVYRLSVNDIHRYNYIDDGKLAFQKKIKGKLHTIRPIASSYKTFSQNTREVSLLLTENLGYVAQIEIGALLVGKIKNNNHLEFSKNKEKGYFEFGGSTIVVLLNKKVEIDDDILEMSKKGIETQVRTGERIGRIC